MLYQEGFQIPQIHVVFIASMPRPEVLLKGIFYGKDSLGMGQGSCPLVAPYNRDWRTSSACWLEHVLETC